MSVLVTGGAGYIGSHMVAELLDNNEEVIVIDNLQKGHTKAVLGGKFYKGDLRDEEVLDKVFKENDIDAIDLDVATCLYAGLITDSGNFSYNSTTVETFEVASELISYGVDHSLLARVLYLETSYNAFSLSLRVLSNAMFYYDKRLGVIMFTSEDFKQTETKLVDTDGIVNILVNIKEVILALSIVEISNNEFKVGLRSKGDFDSSLIAEHFGGGGHKNASGCKLYGPKDEVLNKLVSVSKHYLDKYDKH